MAPAQSIPQQKPVPLLAPKPGYAAPIAALSMPQPSSPSPVPALQTHRFPPGLNPPRAHFDQHGAPRLPPAVTRPPFAPATPISVPSTPHPLPPTMSPILPVFARPSKATQSLDIQWGPEPILRGNSEEKLLPRRGEEGDDFWRRFSMVAREESRKPSSQKQRYGQHFWSPFVMLKCALKRMASQNPKWYESYVPMDLGHWPLAFCCKLCSRTPFLM